MSESYKRLDAVQQEIEDLLKKETELKKKEKKGQLTDEDEVDLEGVNKLFDDLKKARKYWREQYRLWTSFTSELDETVVPSPGFQQAYENVSKAFHMRTGAGRRIFLNLFLSDIVLLPEFKNTLRIFPGIEMSVESKGPKKRRLNGKTDYTVGFGKDVDIFDNTPPRELHLVAIEAKNSSFDHEDLWQCVAETATL
ncbi:hypothetical protein BDV3_001945 [Batrachochytrium dendrobatidis]